MIHFSCAAGGKMPPAALSPANFVYASHNIVALRFCLVTYIIVSSLANCSRSSFCSHLRSFSLRNCKGNRAH